MGKTIKDFNKLIAEQRIAVLGEKEIDVTKIPSGVMLRLMEFADKVEAKELTPKEQFMESINVVAMVCQRLDKEVTTEWLMANTDFDQLMEFSDFVLAPIKERTAGKEKKTEE